MGTALKAQEVHQRIKELNDEDWLITFGPNFPPAKARVNPYVCILFRRTTTVYGYGGNPLSALYDAEANLKEPVSKAARDVVERG